MVINTLLVVDPALELGVEDPRLDKAARLSDPLGHRLATSRQNQGLTIQTSLTMIQQEQIPERSSRQAMIYPPIGKESQMRLEILGTKAINIDQLIKTQIRP